MSLKTTRPDAAQSTSTAQPMPDSAQAVQRKAALRGSSYEDQLQMLAPGKQDGEGGGEGGDEGGGGGFFSQVKGALGSAMDAIKDPKGTAYGARLGKEGRQEEVLGDGHDIANQDVILEQLAHQGAYGRLDPRKLAGWGYREMGAAQDPESGFRAVLYVPSEEALAGKTDQAKVIQAIHGGKPPAVLAFRGTAEKRGMQDDTNRGGVGAYQFASNEARVRDMMALAGGKVIVAGHSLGGALAQLAATHFPSSVSRVVTFQSPGIPKEESDKLAKHNAEAAPEDKVSSTHHRAEGDLVHMAGESLTEGDVYTHKSVGIGNPMDHMSYPLARLSAARGDMIPGVNDEQLGKKGGDKLVGIEKTSSKKEKSGMLPKISEGARKGLGGVVRDESMETYGPVWKSIKEMIASKAFGAKQILATIADSDKLTPDQKIKMRDEAMRLLGPQ